MSIDPTRVSRAEALAAQILDLPAAERGAALAVACEEHPDLAPILRAGYRVLIGAFGADAEGDAGGDEAPALPSIEDHEILRKIGRGGMGVVYLAEQLRPVRRQVAVKMLAVQVDGERVLQRFAAERQALARMAHASIAQVYGAGTTRDGRPYYLMEYVEGEALTRYCDQRRLTVAERVQLFIRVCEGVQHAHQKGIVHRDLKPSNILVVDQEGTALPKIIDFGIAKALEEQLIDDSLNTEEGALIGTLEYMSPEQAGGGTGDLDTRADVYALGVILYELLSGQRPFDSATLRRLPLLAAVEHIRDEVPERPSARLASDETQETAARRSSSPTGLHRRIRGDLDWVTMRALEKDRERRYASVAEFAADLQRYLHKEPVLAGPPSRTYRMRRFVQRHGIAVAAAGAVFLSILTGTAFSLVMYADAREQERIAKLDRDDAIRERERADRRFDQLEDITTELNLDLASRLETEGIASKTRRQLFQTTARHIERMLKESPESLELRRALAVAYRGLGKDARELPKAEARRYLERAAELSREMWQQTRSCHDMIYRSGLTSEYAMFLAQTGAEEECKSWLQQLIEDARQQTCEDPKCINHDSALAQALSYAAHFHRHPGGAKRRLEYLAEAEGIWVKVSKAFTRIEFSKIDQLRHHQQLVHFYADYARSAFVPLGKLHRRLLERAREHLALAKNLGPENPRTMQVESLLRRAEQACVAERRSAAQILADNRRRLEVFLEALKVTPDDVERQKEVASLYLELTLNEYEIGHVGAALANVSRCLEICERGGIARVYPALAQSLVAHAYRTRAFLRKFSMQLDLAAADLQQAIELLKPTLAAGSVVSRLGAEIELAYIHIQYERPEVAKEILVRVRAKLASSEFLEDEPIVRALLQVACFTQLSRVYRVTQDTAESLIWIRRAEKAWEATGLGDQATIDPSCVAPKGHLVRSELERAAAQTLTQPDEIIARLRSAAARVQKSRQEGIVPGSGILLADLELELAVIRIAQSDHEKSEAGRQALQQAEDILEGVLKRDPSVHLARFYLAVLHTLRGWHARTGWLQALARARRGPAGRARQEWVERARGLAEEGLGHLELAANLLEEIRTGPVPGSGRTLRGQQPLTLRMLMIFAREARQPERARPQIEKWLTWMDELIHAESPDPRDLALAAESYANMLPGASQAEREKVPQIIARFRSLKPLTLPPQFGHAVMHNMRIILLGAGARAEALELARQHRTWIRAQEGSTWPRLGIELDKAIEKIQGRGK